MSLGGYWSIILPGLQNSDYFIQPLLIKSLKSLHIKAHVIQQLCPFPKDNKHCSYFDDQVKPPTLWGALARCLQRMELESLSGRVRCTRRFLQSCLCIIQFLTAGVKRNRASVLSASSRDLVRSRVMEGFLSLLWWTCPPSLSAMFSTSLSQKAMAPGEPIIHFI